MKKILKKCVASESIMILKGDSMKPYQCNRKQEKKLIE